MQTYSHFILTFALSRFIKDSQDHNPQTSLLNASTQAEQPDAPVELGELSLPPLKRKAALWGSIMPDVPLTLLSILFIALDIANVRLPLLAGSGMNSNTQYLFDVMFFETPWVQALHNLFHGPILTLLYLSVGYWGWKKSRAWGATLFWFGLACTLHTAIDIPLHYNDGPLIFFPFEWSFRVMSPVSYWDPAHYGIPFAIFEHLLITGVLFFLVWGWWRKRRSLQLAD